MFTVRPVQLSDIPALEALAERAPQCVHTLPRTRQAIGHAVENSLASFADRPESPAQASYLFVLEAPDKSLAGSAAILATAGERGSYFSFRNDTLIQVSRYLRISHDVHALTLCSDLTSHSQLSGFHLHGQQPREAALLSRSRLLFAALAPHRFSEKFIAAMAGPIGEGGRSAFWDALGRKFFRMEFLEAERLIEGARNRTLIAELMPHYPVYVPLLPQAAQEAIGQVHPEGKMPYAILSEEGFGTDDYIDIFDGGPILQAHRNALRTFSQSMARRITSVASTAPRGSYLVATAREQHFRAVVADCAAVEHADSVVLPNDAMRSLDVVTGDTVWCVRL